MFKRLAENFKYCRIYFLYSYHRQLVKEGIANYDKSADESEKERWVWFVVKHVRKVTKYIIWLDEHEFKSLFEKYNKERP